MDIAEDMSNKEEFIFESTPSMVTVSTPEIPQQCGKLSVEDWSCLSKTQKKRMKAKMKGDSVNKGIKNDENSVNVPTPLGNTDHKNVNIFADTEKC